MQLETSPGRVMIQSEMKPKSRLLGNCTVVTGRNAPGCEKTRAQLKTALLRKICRRSVDQQTKKLPGNAIFVPILTVKPALRPHSVSGVERSIASGVSRWPRPTATMKSAGTSPA